MAVNIRTFLKMTTHFMLEVKRDKRYISGDSVNFGQLFTYTGNLDLHVFLTAKDKSYLTFLPSLIK